MEMRAMKTCVSRVWTACIPPPPPVHRFLSPNMVCGLLFLTLTSSSFSLFPHPTLLLLILLFFSPPSLLLPLFCLLSSPPLPFLPPFFASSYLLLTSFLLPLLSFNHPSPPSRPPSLSSPLPLPLSFSEPKPSIISKRKTPAKSGVSLGV